MEDVSLAFQPWDEDLAEEAESFVQNLAPEIAAYLKLRRQDKLPQKPEGMENFYRLAPTFTEFISACKYWDLYGDDESLMQQFL